MRVPLMRRTPSAGIRLMSAVALAICMTASSAVAGYDRPAIVAMFCSEGGKDVAKAADVILSGLTSASDEDRSWSGRLVAAFAAKALRCAGDRTAFFADGSSATTLTPATIPTDVSSPLPSLRSRALLEQVTAAITLFTTTEPNARLEAIKSIEKRGDAISEEILQAARDGEQAAMVRHALDMMIQTRGLQSRDPTKRITAIGAVAADPTSRTITQLTALRADPTYIADATVRVALDGAIAASRRTVLIGDILSLAYNGISAGSVLFLTAVGLAIIFGLMGVINLAQGEFIMIGGYTTFCVQEATRAWAPALLDWYPVIALPIVFIVTAGIGMLIEAVAIRHLYRRPLMTLLATWAIGLLLVNLVRVTFGTQNLQFATPAFLSGGIRVLGDFVITWNHLGAIVVAIGAFIGTLALLRLTDLGLYIRAVTQNRGMAGCIGISTRRVDQLAFGFGAGLAGLAGLALSPIYNVNPTMGSGFIIDSFMVVVLGGVASLFGAAVAAIGIGLVNVGIEPFYGAVAAKVISLLMIIALIQWRPEGLIAGKGRR